MAQFGNSGAHIVLAIMVVGLFCASKVVAQDSGIAPTPPLEAGAGFALSVSGLGLFCSSVLVSLVTFMLQ